MAPYVPLLMPELKAALIDPLPEVRATAAKALGSLLKGMGQQYFEDIVPWLLATLKSEGSRLVDLVMPWCVHVRLCADSYEPAVL